MTLSVLNTPSNCLKPGPRHGVSRTHLMLAGINQTIFVKQWGEPETQIGLHCLGSLCKLGSLFLIAEPSDEVPHSVWIYKKKNRILFFTRKKLTSHFKWTEFKERCKKPEQMVGSKLAEKSSPFMATTLALVA